MLAAPTASAPRAIPRRILLCAAILLAESLIPGSMPHPWFHPQQIMAAPIVFGAAFLFFGRRPFAVADLDAQPIRLSALALHLAALGTLLATSAFLLLTKPHPPATTLAIALWYIAIATMVATLTATLFPIRQLTRTILSMRTAWLYAALTTLAAMSARTLVRALWNAPNSRIGDALQASTFAGVEWLLRRIYPRVLTIPGTIVLGTPHFHVQIAGECSGIEGLTLTLLFTLGWLLFARRELRLARAILLVPAALALSWTLNLLRIAALIALGDAGHPDIALNGFHSEAGWILFNVVAVAFLLTMQNVQWFRRTPHTATAHTGHNPAAPYLIPFLAVLAITMLTRAASSTAAASGNFDWLYPARLLTAVLALWYFRKRYRTFDWRFSWLGPATGAVVFVLWLALANRFTHTNTALAHGLSTLSPWEQRTWLTARVLAAVITVPLTEELAFRGYLARRFIAPDVDNVSYARLNLLAIATSSLAFGLLHGSMWIAATLAGILFALAAKHRNRLGEALAAHATTNLLLAAWVLTRGDYSLW